ncbi:MAG TPA: alpha/beta hydrolase fold domain-containing protein [Candidatus Pullichristensenella stercorigallinarum]|uniref:Alpha/beta hydrolase fold domain-containing protein n=1 Tax=Candidatus Pullichristensenella stercorigallinarum TaxID=2840909 RepID=A0A9D0ZN67_9FIRM|nr:alpha/beta hydrolase fold domain-containing protein [Candidatus Pullichristensenella stercorigallinarum]
MTSQLKEEIPPAYIETAEYDCLHDEGLFYAERLKQNGADVTVYETKGTIHGYDFRLKSRITEESISKRLAFLKRIFKI